MTLLGAIETGGTKTLCAVGCNGGEILAQARFQTRSPDETFEECLDFFHRQAPDHGPIRALGIAAFGPLDLMPTSATFGCLLATTKPDWSGAPIRPYFQEALNIPVAIDTDVNAAVLAEVRDGAAKGCQDAVYMTVGTGIGGGVYHGGQLQHGLIHAELGHIPIPRAQGDETFTSVCPFHDDCAEGLASGPAIQARWGIKAETLSPEHPAGALEAHYLAQLCRTITLTHSPSKIILGGGVMARADLIIRIRDEFDRLVGQYLPIAERAGGLGHYIVPSGIQGDAGLTGAFVLAQEILSGPRVRNRV